MTVLPKGIVSVVQTAFPSDASRVDIDSTLRLVADALAAGVDGFLVPVVASEVTFLSTAERRGLVTAIAGAVGGRVPIVLGASAEKPSECIAHARLAAELGLAASLVAVPQALYAAPDSEKEKSIDAFFAEIARGVSTPLVVQDLQFNGPGMSVAQIARLRSSLPQLAGIKIETAPAGPKYSAVRSACGADFWIAGGWAVPQMIEALDRGVDAMVPESAMIRVYKKIDRLHRAGRRDEARDLFNRLLPVLAFTNQELATSIAFFKKLLVRKKIFATAAQRLPLPAWDEKSERISEELIDSYLAIE